MPATQGSGLGLWWGWAEGEHAWGDQVNENLSVLDVLCQLSVVSSQATVAPSGAPDSFAWAIPMDATGEWGTHRGDIALHIDGEWRYLEARVGWLAYDDARDALIVRTDDGWVPLAEQILGGLLARVDILEGDFVQFLQRIDIVEDALGAQASLIQQMQLRIGDAESAIVQESLARADGDSALAQVDAQLSTRIATAEGDIVAEADAREQLQTRIETAEGAIDAQSTSLTQLGTRIDAARVGGRGVNLLPASLADFEDVATPEHDAFGATVELDPIHTHGSQGLRVSFVNAGGYAHLGEFAIEPGRQWILSGQFMVPVGQGDVPLTEFQFGLLIGGVTYAGTVSVESGTSFARESVVIDLREIEGTTASVVIEHDGVVLPVDLYLDQLMLEERIGELSEPSAWALPPMPIAESSAFQQLQTTVSQHGNNIDASAAQVTALQSSVAAVESGFNANGEAIESLWTEASRIDGEVVAGAGRTTALEATVNDPATGVTATAAALESVETRVEVTESGIAANASAIESLVVGSGDTIDAAVIWYFDADLEGWTATGATVVGGCLRPNSAGLVTSPNLYSSGINGSKYNSARVRAHRVGAPTWNGTLKWRYIGEPAGFTHSVPATEPSWDGDGIGIIDIRDVGFVDFVEHIQLDLHDGDASNYVELDWIAIGRLSPGASTAMVETERNARISGDAAIASSVTTLESRLDNAESDIDGVAGAVSSLTTRVTDAEGDITSNAAAITGVKASLGASNNLLPNSDFALGLGDWFVNGNVAGSLIDNAVTPNLSWTIPERGCLYLRSSGGPLASGKYIQAQLTGAGERVPVEEGKTYIFSAYLGAHRCTGVCYIGWYRADGSFIAWSAPSAAVAVAGGQSLADYGRAALMEQAPPEATSAALLIRALGTGSVSSSDSYLFITCPMVEEALPEQTQASPWAPSAAGLGSAASALSTRVTATEGGISSHSSSITSLQSQVAGKASVSAVNSLTTSVDTLTGKFNARHSVILDVNDNVSGTISENDGTTSKFSILASVFRVISGGTAGMEWQDGYIRIWKGGAQLIIGSAFGAQNNLVLWYGPLIAVSICSKANATIWFDSSGGAYFGGTLHTGILKNAATSTQVSGTAIVETGSFGTNGGSKVVSLSFTYNNGGFVSGNASSSDGLPQTVRVQIQRSINGGAWATAIDQTITGARHADYDPEFNRTLVQASFGGGVSYTDNNGSTSNFNYRAVLSNPSGWPITLGGDIGSQNLTIMSVEE